jgi:hypothetical protein
MTERLREHITKLVSRYCSHLGTTQTRAAIDLFGDRAIFYGVLGRKRDGASFQVATYDRITRTFSERWPDGLAWPRGIPRPASRPDPAAPEAADQHPNL